MPSWKRKRQDRERVKLRDPNVIPARQRKAGPMDPRNKPRGGARNWRHELLDDGTSGQDRKSYTDTQDRKSYEPDTE